MKVHVICHMGASIDGKTLLSRWRPEGNTGAATFEKLHDALAGDAWIVGRTTGQEFSKRKEPYPATTGAPRSIACCAAA